MRANLAVIAVTLACALPFAPNATNSAFDPVQRATDLLCGRVVAVSCTGPSSGVTLFLTSAAKDRRWEIALPPEHRFEMGTSRIENRYELHVVCVPSAKVPLKGPPRPLLDPAQLLVKETSEPPISVPDDVHRTCDPDVELAKPIRTVKPLYTGTAMQAKVQGSVVLLGIVDGNGVVGRVRVIDSLDPALDAEALKAFEQWRFRPAMRRGEVISLAVSAEMSFALR